MTKVVEIRVIMSLLIKLIIKNTKKKMRFTVFVTAIVMATMASAVNVEFDGTPTAPTPAPKPDML